MRKFRSLTLFQAFSPGFLSLGFDNIDPSGAVGSALSFVGGLISNSANKKIAREQMAQQEKLFNTQMEYTKAAEQRQYDYADKVWQRETEYNDPANQKARYEMAGLNPALMMSGQSAPIGSAESVSAPSTPSAPQVGAWEYKDPITPAVQTFLNSRLLNAQVNKTQNEADQLGIDNRVRDLQNKLKLEDMRRDIELKISDKETGSVMRDYYKSLRDQLDQTIKFFDATWDSRMKQEEKKAYVLDAEGRQVEENIKLLQVKNMFAEIQEKYNLRIAAASLKRIYSQIDLDKAMTKTEAGKYAGLILEAAGLVPGTPQYKDKKRLIEAQIYNYYHTDDLGSDWLYNPETGNRDIVPSNTQPVWDNVGKKR